MLATLQTCPHMKHQADGQISSVASQSTPAKRKKLITPLPYEQILAEDVDRAKRKFEDNDDTICLGHAKLKVIKANLLGPILKKRFLGPDLEAAPLCM